MGLLVAVDGRLYIVRDALDLLLKQTCPFGVDRVLGDADENTVRVRLDPHICSAHLLKAAANCAEKRRDVVTASREKRQDLRPGDVLNSCHILSSFCLKKQSKKKKKSELTYAALALSLVLTAERDL